jgi:hypothetical protein|tara:strand:- start:315 stop:503 length:189 start_codon:yes stop_codon:yes gene_type:complete
MIESSLKHLKEAEENYFKHLSRAWSFGASLALASFLAFAHGLIPALFPKTASKRVKSLMGIE